MMPNESTKTETNKEKDKKRILILKKYELAFDKNGKILDKIKNYMKSKKILDFNNEIKEGKLEYLKGPRYDNNKNLIPYSYVGPDRYFIFHRREAIKNMTSIISKDHKHNKDFSRIKSDGNIYSKFIRNFEKKMTNSNFNLKTGITNREEKIKMKKVPKYLEMNLKKQENIFEKLETYENYRENFEKKVMEKTKKNKSDLLLKLNETNYFVNKYSEIDEINANLKNWNFQLRNPKIHGIYKRKGYFKATSLNEDLYSMINLNKNKQIFVNPFNNNFFEKFGKNILKSPINKKLNLKALKLTGTNILEKIIKNKRKKNSINEDNEILKAKSSFRSAITNNFSYDDRSSRNYSENYQDKLFASNYNKKYKYDKKENTYKFHY